MKVTKIMTLLEELKEKVDSSMAKVEKKMTDSKFLTKEQKIEAYQMISDGYNKLLRKQRKKCPKKK